MPSSRTLAACVLLLTPFGMAQTTWVVDNLGRAGAQFATIGAAVSAAAPGDVVLVRASSAPYAGATITRGLRLLGQGRVRIDSELTITGVPAGEHVAVKNIDMRYFEPPGRTQPWGFSEGRAIHCTQNAGTIHFEQVNGTGSQHGPGLHVEDCAHVSTLDCTFRAGVSIRYFQLLPTSAVRPRYDGANVGMWCRRSAVNSVRCRALGVWFNEPPVPISAFSGIRLSLPGLIADASHVVLVAGEIRGGDGECPGYPPFPFPAFFAEPTPGLDASNGGTIVTKSTTFLGGTHVFGPCVPSVVAGLRADPATTIVLDPGITPTIEGGQVTTRELFDLQTAGAPPGQTMSLTLRSAVTAPYFTVASFPGHPLPVPPIHIWVDLLQAVVLAQGTVSGSQSDPFTVPPFFPRGLPAAFQSVLLVRGNLELSTPVVAVLH